MKQILNTIVLILAVIFLTSSSIYSQGNGSDGDLSVNNTETFKPNSLASNLTSNSSIGTNTITLLSTTGFNAGDKILIIQMLSSTASTIGNFEENEVSSISGSTITLVNNLSNSYTDGSANEVTQVLYIPQYANVTINSGGTITSDAWNGETGGIVYFLTQDTLRINSGGVIDVAEKGYTGGTGGVGGLGGAGGTGGLIAEDYIVGNEIIFGVDTFIAGDTIFSGSDTLIIGQDTLTKRDGATLPGGGKGSIGGDSLGFIDPISGQPIVVGEKGGDGGGSGDAGLAGSSGTSGNGPDSGIPSGNTSNQATGVLRMGSGGNGGSGGSGGQGAGGGGAGGRPGIVGGLGGTISNGIEDGTDGADGGVGGVGGNGGIGGGIISINSGVFINNGQIIADGGDGTSGLSATDGGVGGDGGNGADAALAAVGNGGGAGGGGNGAQGGQGGQGGDGGAGGTVWIETVLNDASAVGTTSLAQGNKGSGGTDGLSGIAGLGGNGGSGSFYLTGGVLAGVDGFNAESGVTGIAAIPSQDGNDASPGASYFYSGGTLPIELLFFNAEVVKGDALIQWETASEINNDYFTLEKSYDGLEFFTLEEIKGAGNSSVNVAYSILDTDIEEGTVYYKLTQTDYNGESESFNVIAIQFENAFENEFEMEVYPNPSNNTNVNLNFTNLTMGTVLEIKVIDLFGSIVLEERSITNSNNYVKQITTHLNFGIYTIISTANGLVKSQKLIIN